MIENSLMWKDSRRSNQVLILLNWLFEDELVFEALAVDQVAIIKRKNDRYIALGWCTLIRALLEHGITQKQSSDIDKEKVLAISTATASKEKPVNSIYTLQQGTENVEMELKHYWVLLRLEDCRLSKSYMEMLNQYISGIQDVHKVGAYRSKWNR
ncbi:hypothetical protein MKW98_011354 [Papaver atlanticum]|uniref:Uncharacterized protein n=1 Tax=Papaver atlanticum TaxID=357466 RepID=A0AAD4XKT7_9MAGN|nr:hypothetical protein MKW98_011354 [Papaver atlanticum]